MGHKICLLVFLFSAVLSLPANAQQVIEGTTLNADSGDPVPYVNIGIAAQGTGTVSDASGSYRLTYLAEADSVTISAIGFDTVKIPVSGLLLNPVVRLNPAVYEMDDLVVTANMGERSEIFGYRLTRRGDNIGFGSTQLGTEIGAGISIGSPVQLNSAHFIVNRTGADSLLFRVNLYRLNEETYGQNLIPENVIVPAPSEPGIISVDLEPYGIVARGEVLLSLEWIEAVNMESNEIQGISFRAVRTGRNPNLLFKSTSHAPFQSFSELVPYRLGFYLTGTRFRESD